MVIIKMIRYNNIKQNDNKTINRKFNYQKMLLG